MAKARRSKTASVKSQVQRPKAPAKKVQKVALPKEKVKVAAKQVNEPVKKEAGAKLKPVTPVAKRAPKAAGGISAKLFDALEARKKRMDEEDGEETPVRGRRGRRPKNSEYQPYTEEEEGAEHEKAFEGLEYEAGVKFQKGDDDGGPNFERSDEFDEELNFDW